MKQMNKTAQTIVGLMLIVLGGAYLYLRIARNIEFRREHTLSQDFRKVAVDAVAQLDSFQEVGACGENPVLWEQSVERLTDAVHKAELEVSTARDKTTAVHLRVYYEDVIDRKKDCSGDRDVGMAVMLHRSILRSNLDLNE